MTVKKFRYIYGPVPSWRLGRSLGIDPVSKGRKVCSYDCIYCQVGKTGLLTDERHHFIDCEDIIKELNSLPPLTIDTVTFSGAGEPTLAANLGEMIRAVKQTRKEKVAVITNSSLLPRKDVQEDLSSADLVVAKLDAPTQDVFSSVNAPFKTVKLADIISGLKSFRNVYQGKLALQIMFIGENKACAEDIAQIVKSIRPDEVQINTPLRPCRVNPLSEAELDRVGIYFRGVSTVFVYKAEKKTVAPLSDGDTLKRRGKVL